MPFSSSEGKLLFQDWLLSMILVGEVEQVLDVGAGAGTYADLARGVLQAAKQHKPDARLSIDAIEAHSPYLEAYRLRQKYDRIFEADARQWVKETDQKYDLVIMGDVLEHLPKEDAVSLYFALMCRTKFLFISVPCTLRNRRWSCGYNQRDEEWKDNAFEKHQSQWDYDELLVTLGPFLWQSPFPTVAVLIAEGLLKN
jgi:predicted TPR repeat methyltransferase